MCAKLRNYKRTIVRYVSEPSTNEGKKEPLARTRELKSQFPQRLYCEILPAN